MRIPPDDDFQVGYLTWKGGATGSGGIVWSKAETVGSEDNVDWHPEFTSTSNTAGHDDVATVSDPNGEFNPTSGYYTGLGLPNGWQPEYYEFQSAPLSHTLSLNASRLVYVDLVLQTKALASHGYCSATYQDLDVQLYLNSTFIGGADGLKNLQDAGSGYVGSSQWSDASGQHTTSWSRPAKVPAGYCVLSLAIQSETASWPAGNVFHLKVFQWYQSYQYRLGFAGDHASTILVPVFSTEESLFRSSEPATSNAGAPASAGGVAGIFLAVPAIGKAFRGPRSRTPRNVAVVTLLVSLAASGCLSANPSAGPRDAGESQLQKGPVDASYLNDSSGAHGRGSIAGVVVDEWRRPVTGAHVSILSTGFFSNTNGQGRFVFRNLSVGAYVLRVEQSGFKVFESSNRVAVVSDLATYVEISLEPLSRRDGEKTLHTHDEWASNPMTLVSDLNVGTVPAPPYNGVSFAIPGADSSASYRAVLPGTVLMDVKLTWPNDAPQRVALAYQSVFEQDPRSLGNHGNGDTNRTYLYPRASGEVFHIPVTWEMTDPGHQRFSTWRFTIFPWSTTVDQAERYPYGIAANPWGPFAATITIHKGGQLPLEPGHPDLYGSNRTLLVVNRTGQNGASCLSVTLMCSETDANNITYVPSLIPPQTQWLDVTAQFSRTSLDNPAWMMTYKGAETPPNNCPENRAPSEVPQASARLVQGKAGDTSWRWTVLVKPTEPDPFYAKASAWCLWLGARPGTSLDNWGNAGRDNPIATVQVIAHRDAPPSA